MGKGLRRLAGKLGWKLHSQLAIRDGNQNLHIADFVLETPLRALLLEVKLTFTLAGMDQLFRYAPLVYSVLGKPVVLCQVAMNLRPEAADFPPVRNVTHLVSAADEGPFVHHLMFPGQANL